MGEGGASSCEIRNSPCPECYLCGSKGDTIYRNLEDRLFHVKGKWNVRKCLNEECGLFWLDPKPRPEDLAKLYATYYTHSKDSGNEEGAKLNLLRKWGKFLILYLAKVSGLYEQKQKLRRMYLDDFPPGKLLEVGCGAGERLALLKEKGWDVEGQEIDPKAAAVAGAAPGVTVYCGELSTLSLPGEMYDAVIMSHVLEHVHDPLKLLRESRRLLKEDGQLVLVTPNVESFIHNKFRSDWRDLDPPRHLYLFSPRSLDALLEQAGFAREKIWTSCLSTMASAAGSYEILETERHDMLGNSSMPIMLKSFFVQLIAQSKILLNPLCGEICISRSFKKTV